jgi:hypothetical protein
VPYLRGTSQPDTVSLRLDPARSLISQVPRTQHQFVMKMLGTVLAQQGF